MKLISWNVNGIRAALKNGLLDFIEGSRADIFCFQEIKAKPEQVEADWPEGYHQYWHSAEKKGYAGTAVFTRIKPANVTHGINAGPGDAEGRVMTLEFEDFFLVNVYTVNAKRGLLRLDYRHKEWDTAFLKHVQNLRKSKPVIFCGDLNVAHKEIDLANPKTNHRNAGFTDEEREGFDNYIRAGFIDTFREFESGGGHYTWWSYWAEARERNVGWRIDYFCITPDLRPRLKSAFILPDVFGSDHCPIGVILHDK